MELHGVNVIYLHVCKCIFWGSSLDSVVILVWIFVKVDKGTSWGIRGYGGHCGVRVGEMFGGAIGALKALIINIMDAWLCTQALMVFVMIHIVG